MEEIREKPNLLLRARETRAVFGTALTTPRGQRVPAPTHQVTWSLFFGND